MSDSASSSPGGQPSTTAPIAGPWLSPKVVTQKDRPIVYLFHRHWLWAHTAKLSGLRTVPDGMVRVQGLKMN